MAYHIGLPSLPCHRPVSLECKIPCTAMSYGIVKLVLKWESKYLGPPRQKDMWCSSRSFRHNLAIIYSSARSTWQEEEIHAGGIIQSRWKLQCDGLIQQNRGSQVHHTRRAESDVVLKSTYRWQYHASCNWISWPCLLSDSSCNPPCTTGKSILAVADWAVTRQANVSCHVGEWTKLGRFG